jgi:DNA-binding Lrp family transcriptional regulator
MVEIRKNMNESEYAVIYKFKKLLDDGIISQEDYENKKKEFLDSISNNKE